MPDQTIEAISLPLFVPGNRPDRFAKAANAGADAIIIDLEDAVPPAAKAEARSATIEALSSQAFAVPVIVRINAAGTTWHRADLAACAGLPLAAIMLPKAETGTEVAETARASGLPIIALIETARGLLAAEAVASSAARLAFGSIDFAADIGASHTHKALLYARSHLVTAARAAGQPAPLDGVTVGVNDEAALTTDCRHAQEIGLGGKLLIHPAQIAPARQAFAPSPEELDWAKRILAATTGEDGAIKIDGAMVDAPVILRARRILQRMQATQTPTRTS